MSTNGAVILAGGLGSRYKKQKQFELINGVEMWKFVYDKVASIVDKENIVVVGVDLPGGTTRSESVRLGLENLNKDTERVIIVEAARPLVTVEQLQKLLLDENDSVTFALPLVNTVIGRNGTYYNRDDFFDLLTPQAFNYQMLVEAERTRKYIDTTDETIVMYKEYGIKPKFILDGENLIKVTYQRDLEIIKKMLEKE